MIDVTTGAEPQPAALVTGFETALGLSAARALSSAGYRVFAVHAAESDVSGRLQGLSGAGHGAAAWPSAGLPGVVDLVRAAEAELGAITALVVALPATSLWSTTTPGAPFDAGHFARSLERGAGALMALSLCVLPGMLATQTGTLCALMPAPSGRALGLDDAPSTSAALGAALGAVGELADRCLGTPLRAAALCLQASPSGEERALDEPAAQRLVSELAPGSELENGSFVHLDDPARRGPLVWLEPPRVVAFEAGPRASESGVEASGVDLDDGVSELLERTFRAVLGLGDDVDVSGASVENVPRWDSLGHLKLMMEVEQALRVRLPANALSRIQSYADLESTVRAVMPVR